MKLRIIRTAFLLSITILFLPAAEKNKNNQDPLNVYCNFSEEMFNINKKELVLTFSDQMIPLGGERDGKKLLSISPQIEGEFHWRDTKTLVLKSENRLAYSTRYTITVKNGTASLNNKRLNKELTLTFTTPTPFPIWLSSASTWDNILHNKTLHKFPVNKPLLLKFNQPVSQQEVTNKIVVTKKNSASPLDVSCTQKSANTIVLNFSPLLERETTYRILFKKGFTGSEGNTGTIKKINFFVSTRKLFKVTSRPQTIRKNVRKIRVSFSYKLQLLSRKHIRVYILQKGKPKIPCQFNLELNATSLDIYPTDPLTEGQKLEIKINKNIKSIHDEKLNKDVRFTVRICSVIPEIFPALEKQKPELYFSGIKNIEFSLTKYKDSLLNSLTECHTQTWKKDKKILLDKKHIAKKYIFKHQCENGEPVRFPLEIKNSAPNQSPDQSPYQKGLYVFKIDYLDVRNTCNDPQIKAFAEKTTSTIKLIYNKDIDFVVRAGYNKTFVWVFNNKSLQGIQNAEVTLIRKLKKTVEKKQGIKKIPVGKTNKNGVCIGELTLKYGDLLVATDPQNKQKAFYRIYSRNSYNIENETKKMDTYQAELFTDRYLYRPGSKVHIGGVVKHFYKGKLNTPKSRKATLTIYDPSGKSVKTEELQLDKFGGFKTDYLLGKNCEKGEYALNIACDNWEESFEYIFEADYYQSGAIRLGSPDEKRFYGKNETFNPRITGRYFSGNPMNGEKLEYYLKVERYDKYGRHGRYGTPFNLKGSMADYNFGIDSFFKVNRTGTLAKNKYAFNATGTFKPAIALDKIKKLPYINLLYFSVKAESEEGKEAWYRMWANYFPGDRAVGIDIPWGNTIGKPIDVKLAVIDSSTKLVETRASLLVYRYEGAPDDSARKWKKFKEYKNLTLKGEDTFTLEGLEPGSYLLKCDAIDKDGDILSTSSRFYVGYYRYSKANSLSVRALRATAPGEKFVNISIKAPKKGTALLTVENKKTMDYYLIPIDTPFRSKIFKVPFKETYFPTVKMETIAIYEDGTHEENELWLIIPESIKKLKVEILPRAKELLPSTQSKLTVKVTDRQGKGKKSRVFVYAVNEAVLSLMERYRSVDLLAGFYFRHNWFYLTKMTTLTSLAQKDFLSSLGASVWNENAGCIIGRVTDEKGNPLQDVNVQQIKDTFFSNNDKRKMSLTNKDGFFLLVEKSYGDYTLSFQKRGYKEFYTSVYLDCETRIREVAVTLTEKTAAEKAAEEKKRARENINYPGDRKISGTVVLVDGNVIPGADVTLYRYLARGRRITVAQKISRENGNFVFDSLPMGNYGILSELEGFNKIVKRLKVSHTDVDVTILLEMGSIKQEIQCVDNATTSIIAMAPRAAVFDSGEFRSLLRKNFEENLFFQIVETDDTGTAELTFTTSDTLSVYRIMAVAYSEESFGKAEEEIQVTRDLYLEETMPEFARKNDRFRAGVQVSNRTDETLDVNLKLKVEPPEGRLSVTHPGHGATGSTGSDAAKEKDTLLLKVPSKGNKPVYYNFHATGVGEAELYFYARTDRENAADALLKKLPVFDNIVTESILDFDSGRDIGKHIDPGKIAENGGRLNLNVTPSILKPAGHIANKLIFYPYECMEQRASKVMPFLMLEEGMLETLGITIDKKQVRKSIEGYIKIIPEFIHSDGGLSYYRGGMYHSDYLTLYVYWSLKLAMERGIAVKAAAEVKKILEKYLNKASFTGTNLCFHQYLLSLDKRASAGEIKELYKRRGSLSLMARGFLYRAIHNQSGKMDRKKTKKMYEEFRKQLRVEGRLAYFGVGNYIYCRDWPFYSSRYVTALLLQAILEVEGAIGEAPHIMNWLIKVPSYMWETTQTNFWILAAMKQYSLTVEKNTAKGAQMSIANRVMEKDFRSRREVWEVEEELEKGAKPFRIGVKADERVYMTTEMEYRVDGGLPVSRGIIVRRNVYNRAGKIAEEFSRGEVYQVEILVDFDKELPYGVIDEPIAAGFEMLREDFSTTGDLDEFNKDNRKVYYTPYWTRREHSADRVTYYSYSYGGKKRFVYFIKALYSGKFTWMPTTVQGMYNPQYYGRTTIRKIEIKKEAGS